MQNQTPWQTIKWLAKAMMHLFGRGRRFVLLSPNFMTQQVVYDRQTKSFFKQTIRDGIDYKVLEQVYLSEEYDLSRLERYADLIAAYRMICSSNGVPLILDLGAHAGLASKYLCREFPKAQIIAMEPDAENCAVARMNLANEGNVEIIHGGISHRSGNARLVPSSHGSWASRTTRDETGTIHLYTVNAIVETEARNACVPFIVKIDIEGFEHDLFMANTEWIDRFPLVIIELHDWLFPGQRTSSNFLTAIAGRDRDFVYAHENIFSIKNMESERILDDACRPESISAHVH